MRTKLFGAPAGSAWMTKKGVFYDQTDSTYIVSTFDKVIKATVTASGDVVSDWINQWDRYRLNHLIVGLVIEWCPHGYHGTNGEENPIALLQLCVGVRCLVFQLLYQDYIPDKLKDFLLNDRFKFVGVGIRGDVEKLNRQYALEVRNPYDLGEVAATEMGRQETRRWGLQGLVREIMGVNMEKPRRVKMSNWANRVLSEEQIEYAVLDAYSSFEVGKRLYVGNF